MTMDALLAAGPALPLALALLWLAAAAAIPFLRAHRRWPALWLLIATGVPLVGLMTLKFGPVAGLIGFALGVLMLARPPRGRAI